MEFETEIEDNGRIYITSNLPLSDGELETYTSTIAMEEGSPVAQALAIIEGIAELEIDENELTVIPEPDAAAHAIIHEITAVLKDFFL